MMYISAFPFIESAKKLHAAIAEDEKYSMRFIRRFIGRHTFFIFMAVQLVTFIEDDLIENSNGLINTWYIIFEVISAYGNVGLSISLSTQSFSLSGNFTTPSKVIIFLTMLLGKFRAIPKPGDPLVDFDFNQLTDAIDAKVNDEEEQQILISSLAGANTVQKSISDEFDV